MCVREFVRACVSVRACVCVYVGMCLRACVCTFVFVCLRVLASKPYFSDYVHARVKVAREREGKIR